MSVQQAAASSEASIAPATAGPDPSGSSAGWQVALAAHGASPEPAVALDLPRTPDDLGKVDSVLRRAGLSAAKLGAQASRQGGTLNVTFVDDFTTKFVEPSGKVRNPLGLVPGNPNTHGDMVVRSFLDGLSDQQKSHIGITRIDYAKKGGSEDVPGFLAAVRQAADLARAGKTQGINISNEPEALDLAPDARRGGFTMQADPNLRVGSLDDLTDGKRQELLGRLSRDNPAIGGAFAGLRDLGVPVTVASGNDGETQGVGLAHGVINVGARSNLPDSPLTGNRSSTGAHILATENGDFFGSPQSCTSDATPRVLRDVSVDALSKANLADPGVHPAPAPAPAGAW